MLRIRTGLLAAIIAATLSMPVAADELNLRLGARDIGSLDPALTKTGDDETVVLPDNGLGPAARQAKTVHRLTTGAASRHRAAAAA
jgi:hypothetical protein